MNLSTSLREIPRLKCWELGDEAIVFHVNVVPISIMSVQACLMKGAFQELFDDDNAGKLAHVRIPCPGKGDPNEGFPHPGSARRTWKNDHLLCRRFDTWHRSCSGNHRQGLALQMRRRRGSPGSAGTHGVLEVLVGR